MDLLKFDFPVVFAEPVRPASSDCDDRLSTRANVSFVVQEIPSIVTSRGGPTTATQSINAIPAFANELATDLALWSIVDPDMNKENLVEAKHRRLVRSHRTGPLDRELKPNATIRDRLNVSSPPYLASLDQADTNVVVLCL